MKHAYPWFRQFPTSMHRQIKLLIKGASGADRREKYHLRRQLRTLKAEHHLLSSAINQIRHQLSLANRGWQIRYDELLAERDDLQLEIWELEDLIEELFGLLTTTAAWEPTLEATPLAETTQLPQSGSALQPLAAQSPIALPENPTELATVNLAGIKLALVGGHNSTRRGVITELSQQYGLAHWVELPPFSKHSLGRSNIKAKIHDCDLIVLITGYMRHKQTESIAQLRKLGTLSGDVLLLSCRGKSGVVREILTYIRQKNC
ncbi:MAG: hypothetical protein AAFX78_17735 [Cyanobacteria bacterium J06638_20]